MTLGTILPNAKLEAIADSHADAMQARADLIAAAPDLLEVTKAWVDDIDRMLAEAPRHEVAPHVRELVNRARAAIAKATN